MATILMFKETGGYHNALPHEVQDMEADGWAIVVDKPTIEESRQMFDYAIHKEGWKRVVRVCDTEEGAIGYAMRKFGSMDGVTIEPRARV